MTDWPYKGATQREHDLAAYGPCQVPGCREPRRGRLIDDPNSPSGKMMTMVCYAGHRVG